MGSEHDDIVKHRAFIADTRSFGDSHTLQTLHSLHTHRREHVLASMALLLGPETDDAVRQRAARRLAKQELTSLPLILTTLSQYPDITTPAWPCWPPQYQYCARLLLQLSQRARVSLESLLQHPALPQPVGPVLWISAIEAADIHPSTDHEALLRAALSAEWATVRYAAAMALANLAGIAHLSPATHHALQAHLSNAEAVPVRLATAFALMRSNDNNDGENGNNGVHGKGLTTIIELLGVTVAADARRAALFLLATAPPSNMTSDQQEHVTRLLLIALQDSNGEIALNAAHILSTIATPAILPALHALLEKLQPQTQIAVLTALEEMASRPSLRGLIVKDTLPAHISMLLRSHIPEVRRQASFTLAACGGDYAAAALGIIMLSKEHPGQLEAIEGIRLLRNALRPATLVRVTGWLLQSLDLAQSQYGYKKGEELQIAALDSLAYLAYLASQTRGKRRGSALAVISSLVFSHEQSIRLLTSSSAWVRQRTIECYSLLVHLPHGVLQQLLHILRTDEDSGVRACCACTLGAIGDITNRDAIPALIQALLDRDEAVAETALYALCRVATPADTIVHYAIRELAMHGHAGASRDDQLARAAQKQLNIWDRGQ